MIEGASSINDTSAYELAFDLDGSSFAVRNNLVDILERELLGPAHGPEEVLPYSPRSQYLVGHIAPVKLAATAVAEADIDEPGDRGDLIEVRSDDDGLVEGRGMPAFAADETDADHDDDDAEARAPKKGLMIPASMGLRFQVPAELAAFAVTASWGTYETVPTEEVTKSGRKIRHYKRTPVEVTKTIDIPGLLPGQTFLVPLVEHSCLRIDRYDDAQFGRVLIEIALCNDRETPMPIPIGMWMFQTQLRVHAIGAEVFLPVRDVLDQDWAEHDEEVQRLNLQYRNRLEFAIGRTCSVDWVVANGSRRATEVSTTWLAVAETSQTAARAVENAVLGMDALSCITADDLATGMKPLITGYGAWVQQQKAAVVTLPVHLQEIAGLTVDEAEIAHKRLADGLAHVAKDAEALRCFNFMNRAMRDQRIASQVAAIRASDPSVTIEQAQKQVASRGPQAASWRPFQLAFILMQLGALTDPAAPVRSKELQARVELLFFPTGGGKTEAYLGLAAYTFAIRRRQGVVASMDGPLDGRNGVAVLMRYTLRLLTAQQFQRATALMCAVELARLDDVKTWGTEPFRIGLWVGTDVSPKRFEEANEQLTKVSQYGSHRLTVLQIQRCPWCGTPITAAQVRADSTTRRIHVYCGDDLARCPFAKGGQVTEGLPILTVDEEIYRLTPAFVIATVDKFARLAREGEAASLFGYVSRRCERHGYAHPDYLPCATSTSHTKTSTAPSASVQPVGRLRPPDLIIQDELHLITGALGTAVGLFEVAVETLCSWRTATGEQVRPLIVASTATVRNAGEQVRGLYGRQVEIFPPQVLDVADTYFSQEIPVTSTTPGRRYIGISAQGVRLSSAEIRVSEVLLLAGQLLFDQAGLAADPYMTLVGYFNATRELAGMARYMADDISNRVGKPPRDSGFPRRYGTGFNQLNTAELTSRIASAEIGRTLDRLGLEFNPDVDSTTAIQARMAAARAREHVDYRKGSEAPFDVVLATSMLQVGVDVQRLGLMLVVGQPKNTAEYIQASSRVGRDQSNRPGLVVALGNWARPRDLAHFEQFRHYHETFYAQVEALSVTPFSPTSLARGIDGLLVSVARVAEAASVTGLSPERNAGRIHDQRGAVEVLIERLRERISEAAQSEAVTKQAHDLLVNRLDRWTQRAKFAGDRNQTLVYGRAGDSGRFLPLIISPENFVSSMGSPTEAPFQIANSMREVQPEINLLVSPLSERLFSVSPEGAPSWDLPVPVTD